MDGGVYLESCLSLILGKLPALSKNPLNEFVLIKISLQQKLEIMLIKHDLS